MILLLLGCKVVPTKAVEAREDVDGDGVHWTVDCNDNDRTIGAPALWFVDLDADGFGELDADGIEACDPPDGFATSADDCNDNDAEVNPDAEEQCNGIDDDCSGRVDDDVVFRNWFPDADADGHGASDPISACSRPDGHVRDGDDCDDDDPGSHPGAEERCDGKDNDCDTTVDEDQTYRTWREDKDGDGYGDPSTSHTACGEPAGYVLDDTDCDDANDQISPGITEACNGIDDNCNGLIDDEEVDLDPASATAWHTDEDGDGFGNAFDPQYTCHETLPDRVADGSDCDDDNADVYPGGPELCDLLDNDCDSLIDEGVPIDWYRDADGDTFGIPDETFTACFQPAGYVFDTSDCDDTNDAIHPFAPELCDGIDNDCDILVDGADPDAQTLTWWVDVDGDGYGNVQIPLQSCDQPDNFVDNPDDCDDNDEDLSPGHPELCNGVDDNCDDIVDDLSSIDAALWHPDTDSDGFGDPAVSIPSCDPVFGHVDNPDDCDDDSNLVNPDATEVAGNEVDENCDGDLLCHLDIDDDGHGGVATVVSPDLACDAAGEAVLPDDCNDAVDTIHPSATEMPGGEVDENCDGMLLCHQDLDGDSYGSTAIVASGDLDCTDGGESPTDDDCHDGLPAVNPGGTEVPGNEVDEDCNGGLLCYRDADRDGHGIASTVVSADLSCAVADQESVFDDDCDDTLDVVHPSHAEVCSDGLDNDCDGTSNACTPVGDYAPSASWTPRFDAATPGDMLGEDLFAGDLDGDGGADLLVSAPDYAGGGGAVYVFSGPFTGATSAATDYAARLTGPAGSGLGSAIDIVGKVDGDNAEDWLVGARSAVSGDGRVWLHSGLVGSGSVDSGAVATWTGTALSGEGLGGGVTGGDFDDDGVIDFVLGAPSAISGAGRVYLQLGPVSGSYDAASAAWATYDGVPTGGAGSMLANVGDFDGDTIDDFAIGSAPDNWVYLMTDPQPGSFYLGTDADMIIEGEPPVGSAGDDLDGVPDMNGDGRDELLVGDPTHGFSAGNAYLVFGQATPTDMNLADADVILDGGFGTLFARSVTAIEDFDLDGIPDVAAGGTGVVSRTHIFFGPLTGTIDDDDADVIISGSGMGRALAAGDHDLDGDSDLFIGSPTSDTIFVMEGGGL